MHIFYIGGQRIQAAGQARAGAQAYEKSAADEISGLRPMIKCVSPGAYLEYKTVSLESQGVIARLARGILYQQ